MRLIDADKLPWVDRVILVDQVDGDINITIAKEHTSYVNDETPTVKAIPIEFIEKYLEKWKHAETYDIVHSWWLIIKKDWEKENEL